MSGSDFDLEDRRVQEEYDSASILESADRSTSTQSNGMLLSTTAVYAQAK